MNYSETLAKLDRLLALADPPLQTKEAQTEMSLLYGEVQEVFTQIVGTQNVEVEVHGGRGAKATYPNLFAAGYLSGRSTYSHVGLQQLLTVIGRVRALSAGTAAVRDEPSISSLSRMLHRYRQCCQYVKQPPQNEKDVQDILWIMLRSHFDRVDREDVLPRLGAKTYRPDFGLPEVGVFVEAKYIGDKTAVATLQEEILADIPGYLREGSPYGGIVVLVYDAAHKLRDERKFIEELRQIDGIIDVIVVPGVG